MISIRTCNKRPVGRARAVFDRAVIDPPPPPRFIPTFVHRDRGGGGGGQRSRHRRRIERGFRFRSVRLFPDGIALTKRRKTVYTGGPMRQRRSNPMSVYY